MDSSNIANPLDLLNPDGQGFKYDHGSSPAYALTIDAARPR